MTQFLGQWPAPLARSAALTRSPVSYCSAALTRSLARLLAYSRAGVILVGKGGDEGERTHLTFGVTKLVFV